MPRPVARAYEAVCFALEPVDAAHRAEWAARVALRWIATLRSAGFLTEQPPGAPINAPDLERAHRLSLSDPFPAELSGGVPFALMRLARVHGAPPGGPPQAALRGALSHLAYLARYRIVARGPSGLRLLLGPRIEVPLPAPHPDDEAAWTAAGATALLVDPTTGRWLSLDPLACWLDTPGTAFGRLLVLRRVASEGGNYIEDGVPGCPGVARPLAGRPARGVLGCSPELVEVLTAPPARFFDGCEPGSDLRVEGLIWRGGTSDIYAARAQDGAPVVLKTFEYPGVFDENFWRFRNEERFAQGVDHPAVIRPRNLDLPGYGTVQLQPRIERGALQDLVDAHGVLPLPEAVRLTTQLLDTLGAVHAAGVIHNDVKPDNLLFDDDGRVHLIDFGIAWRLQQRGRPLRPGVPPGSPGYVAPELRAGQAPSVRSDLYAVGAVLRRMTCGASDALLAHADVERRLPEALRSFVGRCLAQDPSLRFDDAAQARAALQALAPSLRAQRGVALDIEGTLVGSYYDRRPRPGLAEFLRFCLDTFDRVFIYTMLSRAHAAEVIAGLVKGGDAPADFVARAEYIPWPRGADGSGKDLRRCRLPVAHNALVDDTRSVIPEDQRHRWVAVPDFGAAGAFDRGLYLAQEHLQRLFAPVSTGDRGPSAS